MEKLLEILKKMKPGVDFEKEDDLIGKKIFDSLAIVMLVSELCDAFDVEITPPDIVPENFHSAKAMWEMIERLEDE